MGADLTVTVVEGWAARDTWRDRRGCGVDVEGFDWRGGNSVTGFWDFLCTGSVGGPSPLSSGADGSRVDDKYYVLVLQIAINLPLRSPWRLGNVGKGVFWYRHWGLLLLQGEMT